MLRFSNYIIILSFALVLSISCTKEASPEPESEETKTYRVFKTSFESVDDFDGFYITPHGDKGTTFHEQSDEVVRSGGYSHKAWMNGTNETSSATINNNHRGYPTIQLYKTESGAFKTPCYITLWVWLDMELQERSEGDNDWFSFATFCSDTTDAWSRTVLVNLSHDGFVHLQHVPLQGRQTHIFQTDEIPFPQKQWVELKVYLDFSDNGYAKVWQNGKLVSHAHVDGTEDLLAQIHFGMYAPPYMSSGTVYNDDVRIEEVAGE